MMTLQQTEKNAEKRRREGAGIDQDLTENKISSCITDAAIEVHTVLGGPGLLESIYENALAKELKRRNIPFQRQLAVPVIYKGETLVDNTINVEIKATEYLLRAFNDVSIFRRKIETSLKALVKKHLIPTLRTC